MHNNFTACLTAYKHPTFDCYFIQARVHVPDERFKWLCSTYGPKSEVPAFLDIVDIAGLVKYVFRARKTLFAFLVSQTIGHAATLNFKLSCSRIHCPILFILCKHTFAATCMTKVTSCVRAVLYGAMVIDCHKA